jgi:hypothetical protein
MRVAQDVTSSPDPLHLSNQRFLNPPDEPPSSIDPLQQEERELSAAIHRKMSLSIDLIDIPPSFIYLVCSVTLCKTRVLFNISN